MARDRAKERKSPKEWKHRRKVSLPEARNLARGIGVPPRRQDGDDEAVYFRHGDDEGEQRETIISVDYMHDHPEEAQKWLDGELKMGEMIKADSRRRRGQSYHGEDVNGD